jgi:hypothetical protein
VLPNREGYGLEIGSVSGLRPACLGSGVNVVAVSAGTQMSDLTLALADSDPPSLNLAAVDER